MLAPVRLILAPLVILDKALQWSVVPYARSLAEHFCLLLSCSASVYTALPFRGACFPIPCRCPCIGRFLAAVSVLVVQLAQY